MKDPGLRLYACEPASDGIQQRPSRLQIVTEFTRPERASSDDRPDNVPATTALAALVTARVPDIAAPLAAEADIIAVLDQAAAPGESASNAFRRKEHSLGELFATLSIVDALSLHRRLTLAKPADPIARRFALLVPERKARLLSFLADARRRAAIASGRSR